MRNLFLSKTARQSGSMYLSKVIEMAFALIVSIILTRSMSPDSYGKYSLFFAVCGIVLLFFRLGLADSVKYLLANTSVKDENSLLGASVVTLFVHAAFYCVFMFFLGFFIDDILKVEIGYQLRIYSPLLFAFTARFFILSWGIGLNKIVSLSISVIVLKFLDLILVAVFFIVMGSSNFNLALLAQLLPYWLVASVFIVWLKPSFKNIKQNLKLIWKTNKDYGMKVYMGQIANQATYRLDKVFLAYFLDAKTVGFYSIADTGTLLLVGFPASLASSMFKSLANKDRIPDRAIRITVGWLVFGLAMLYFLGPWVIETLFSEKYISAIQYIYPLGIAAFFQGLYQPYNAYLGGKGKGNELRFVSFTEGIINVVGNYFFIKYYGALGACWVSVIAKITDFCIYLYFYHKCRRKLENRRL